MGPANSKVKEWGQEKLLVTRPVKGQAGLYQRLARCRGRISPEVQSGWEAQNWTGQDTQAGPKKACCWCWRDYGMTVAKRQFAEGKSG
jgi:hypothetical protein